MEIDKIKELNITFDTYRTIKINRSKTDENYTKALNLYNEMKIFDISFDTGICDNFWYWELDWSLVGATDQSIMHMLAHQNIEYELIEREVVEEE